MQIALYGYLVLLGVIGGICLCLPTIVKLRAFKAKFDPKKRDRNGRFLPTKREKTAQLRRELGL